MWILEANELTWGSYSQSTFWEEEFPQKKLFWSALQWFSSGKHLSNQVSNIYMQINQWKNQDINTDPPESMFPASQCFQLKCSIWPGSNATSEGIYDFIVDIKFMMVADCLSAQICVLSCSMYKYNRKKCAKRMMSRVLTTWFDQDLMPLQKAFMISLLISSSWWSLTVLVFMFHI